MNIFQSIKKYPKDSLIGAAVVVLAITAISADGWSDYAAKPFWWKFWSVIGVTSFLALVAGWLYLVQKDKSSKK